MFITEYDMIMNDIFFALFYIAYMLLILSAVVYVVLDNRNPVKAMSWILLLSFLPGIGLILYFFLGRSNRKERLISRKGYSRLAKRPMTEYQMQESLVISSDKSRIMSFFRNVNSALPFEGNKVYLYPDGKSMLLSLLKSIHNAKHHIHIEFYIFEDDSVGRLLRDALIDKAREGIKIRVLYDDVGCWKVNKSFYEQMLCEGIEVQGFLKVRFPVFTSKVNYRNHRKIVVIDGKTGFIGGMNIAKRYIYGFEWGIWRDTHAKITGKAVYGLQTAFLIDWFAVERALITSPEYFPKNIYSDFKDTNEDGLVSGSSIVQIVTSDPVGKWRDIMQGYVMAINNARNYIYIQTPYLLPTEPVLTALQTAALAGVDVRIMIPRRGDSWIIHKGTMSYIDDMLEAGVKVYMYRKGFLHSKLMVSDDLISTVGSTNMDFRSFEHNFEANAFFFGKETALAIKDIFLEDIKSSLLLTTKIWNSRSVKNKISESVIRLFSPLL